MEHQELDRQVKQHFGFSMSEFLEPISSSMPAGQSVRDNGVYQAIMDARREDDPTLPMGVWVHELKKAEWGVIKETAADALISKSKDLQITVWLLEAEIHTRGFQGIAPAVHLISGLCKKYWDSLFPEIIDNDIEYRINPFVWANDKLMPALRMIPVTDEAGGSYTWNDFEMARRYDRLRSKFPGNKELEDELSLEDVSAGVAATGTRFLVDLAGDIKGALYAIGDLSATLESLCGDDSPGLPRTSGLLDEIKTTMVMELSKRGVVFDDSSAPDEIPDEVQEQAAPDGPGGSGPGSGSGSGGGGGSGPIKSRREAYARLSEAAEYLIRLDPHSPSPYLVRRAIEWGALNTAELYDELFVKLQGNLNIFELLGIDIDENEN